MVMFSASPLYRIPRYAALLCLIALVALAGCVSTDSASKSLVGHPSSELVARWGEPQMKMPDGTGGEAWTYIEKRELPSSDPPRSMTYNTVGGGGAITPYNPAPSRTYTEQRTFSIGSDGIIKNYERKEQ